jgi:uncharacterized membrane protein
VAILFAAAVLGWAAAIFVARIEPHFASLVYVAGSIVCHQIPERSFHMAGFQLPVCARCTALYAGAAIGVIVWAVWRPAPFQSPRWARRAVIAAAAPTLITAATAFMGLWDPDNGVRAALAVPLGMTVSAVVMAVLAGELR